MSGCFRVYQVVSGYFRVYMSGYDRVYQDVFGYVSENMIHSIMCDSCSK